MASEPGNAGGGSIDFGRAFAFYFEDPDWVKKALIGGGLLLGGILGLALLLAGIVLLAMVAGYMMRVMQRAYAGDPRPLPEWEDFGGLMRDGFKMILLSLGYTLLLFGPLALAIGAITAVGSMSGSDTVGGLMAVLALLLQLVWTLLSIGYSLYAPSAFARMTLYQRLGAGFEFKENLALIKRNPANYFLGLVIIIVAHVVAVIGLVGCCVGIFATAFWSYCVTGYVLGEVVRRDPLIGQPLAVAPAPTPGL